MRKRFTIKPIGAEYNHPKFAGVNNALLFFLFGIPSDFISKPTPLPPYPPMAGLYFFWGRGGESVAELGFFY